MFEMAHKSIQVIVFWKVAHKKKKLGQWHTMQNTAR